MVSSCSSILKLLYGRCLGMHEAPLCAMRLPKIRSRIVSCKLVSYSDPNMVPGDATKGGGEEQGEEGGKEALALAHLPGVPGEGEGVTIIPNTPVSHRWKGRRREGIG